MNILEMFMPDPYAPIISHLEWLVKTNGEKIVVSKNLLEIAKKRLGKKWCEEFLLENKLLSTKG